MARIRRDPSVHDWLVIGSGFGGSVERRGVRIEAEST